MTILIVILFFTFLISLGSLLGAFTLSIKQSLLEKILLFLVSLSAGALMGGAFLHLLPEAAEKLSPDILFPTVLFSFISFFLIEKLLHWRHCHKGHCEIHSFGHMNLIGDGVHNFIDGLIIAGAFLFNIKLGLITTLAIAFHEIPQEIGDFGVLLYSGWNKKKALIVNFLIALMVIVGGLFGYFLAGKIDNLVLFLMPFAAGGFIYIAASDLMPEIRKEPSLKKSLISFIVFLLGVLFMFLLKLFI